MPCAVILTSHSEDYLAVCAHLTELQEREHPQGTVYEIGKFSENDNTWEVAIAEIAPGNSDAAMEAERAIAAFEPDIVLSVGTAIGIHEDIEAGDVIAGINIYGYESGKETKTGFSTRPKMGLASYRLEQRAKATARKKAWIERVQGRQLNGISKAKVGAIAAGEKEISSTQSETYKLLQLHYNDALAVDASSYGILKAVHANANTKALIIRGISHIVDQPGPKIVSDNARVNAAQNASAFAFAILAKLYVPETKQADGPIERANEASNGFNKYGSRAEEVEAIVEEDIDTGWMENSINNSELVILSSLSNSQFPARAPDAYLKFQVPLIEKIESEYIQGDKQIRLVKKYTNEQAKFYIENCIKRSKLKLLEIPGGALSLGQTVKEKEELLAVFSERDYLRWFNFELSYKVRKLRTFWMSQFPINQSQWEEISKLPKVNIELPHSPSYFKGNSYPVESVSWQEAKEFCNRLARVTGISYRLPTEIEWEYACRAGKNTPFHFGKTIGPSLANYCGINFQYYDTLFPGNYGEGPKGKVQKKTTPVNQFPPNAYGLQDMHGNVWEWCEDTWFNCENENTFLDYAEPYRVVRGGSWRSSPYRCRSASRHSVIMTDREKDVGFRIVCDPF